MADTLVVTDKVYSEVTHTFKAEYIESLDVAGHKDLMLDIITARSRDCLFLNAAEVDAMIEFFTLVRSKMGE